MITAAIALYLDFFVLVVQSFELAPTQSEPPFLRSRWCWCSLSDSPSWRSNAFADPALARLSPNPLICTGQEPVVLRPLFVAPARHQLGHDRPFTVVTSPLRRVVITLTRGGFPRL